MPEVEVNGAKLFYQEAGSGHETVVFSHSYMLDSNHFSPQMEALKDRYRCLAYDHRGHGRSEKTETGYDMENLYADAVGFIQAMDCAPCHFVGLSTGGFIGCRLGIRRPDLVKSLILMETSADAETSWNLVQYNVLLWVVRLLGFGPIIGQLMPKFFSPNFLKDPAKQDKVAEYKALMSSCDRMAVFKFGMGIFNRAGVYDQLEQIKTPTLMIVGEEDVPTPVEKAKRIAEGIPGAKLVTIPRAGHISTIEQPAAVNSAIEEFLAGVS